jgi:hypothetical protein
MADSVSLVYEVDVPVTLRLRVEVEDAAQAEFVATQQALNLRFVGSSDGRVVDASVKARITPRVVKVVEGDGS